MESRACYWASVLSLVILTALCQRAQGQDDGECPADGRTWVPFGQSCYHFVHGEEDKRSYTLDAAKDMCRGFALLTVRSAEVNKFVLDYSKEVWQDDTDVWLGMYFDSDDDKFKWHDQTPLSFTNWAAKPSADGDVAQIDKCIVLHSTSGKWDNVSCSGDEENGVVCEAQKTARTGKNGSRLLSALVILSVVVILGVSAVFWFLQQRYSSGSSLLPSFEYHPPFRAPSADHTCLVEAEEFEESS